MKKISNVRYIFIFPMMLALVLSIAGCNDEDAIVDTTDPVVSNVLLNDTSPDEDIEVNPGTTMHFDAVFSDDVRLGELKIDIHNNFDGHSHGRINEEAEPFSDERIIELIGREQTVHEDFVVPDNAATGPYHFNIQFFDNLGNEGDLMTIEFEIVDEAEQPLITINNPTSGTEVESSPGGTFTLDVDVSDPDGLEEVHAYLMEEHEDHDHDHGRVTSEEPIWEIEVELNGALEYQIDETVTIPANAEVGHYELKIKAIDMNGNVKIEEFEVHVE